MTPDTRLDDIMGLELLLNLPPGSHRDPCNIGGVAPRWPTAQAHCPENTGKLIGRFKIDLQTFTITPIEDISGDCRDELGTILSTDEHAQS